MGGQDADVVVVGGGLVGLATAHALAGRGSEVVVCEKEDHWAGHQSGHNSGVVHSGLYYQPGGLKAALATKAAAELGDLCSDWGVAYRKPGKLVVAVEQHELGPLGALAERGRANGVPVRELSPAEVREREPYVRCVGALEVGSTGVCDFPALARALAGRLAAAGAQLQLGTTVRSLVEEASGVRVVTSRGEIRTARVVNCAGLYSDRLLSARQRRDVRIVPFRGEYWALREDRSDLVGGLVYPVPDPDLPFLGVHLTRDVHDHVHIGPNAVLALSREGYRRRDVNPGDVVDALTYPGLWRMARHHAATGVGEAVRSLIPALAIRALQRMLPDVQRSDLVSHPAGVRAQAVNRDGQPCDDFVIRDDGRVLHVINAPSPAATASILIGQRLAGLVTGTVSQG